MLEGRLPLDQSSSVDWSVGIVRAWIEQHVPAAWREAARQGGAKAIRAVRTRDDYEAWYPIYSRSGLVVPTWEPEYGGLGVTTAVAQAITDVLRPFNLRPLNILGLNNTAAALFMAGTDAQRRRFLPPMVANDEKWCQLFSEPGSGSDLASLATRAERDGDDWVITGQKVWTTWADHSDFAILLARTDPGRPKHQGITYFLLDLHQRGVEVRPLHQITGEAEFNEVFLDGARASDFHRVGDVNDGWRIAGSTLSSERQMVAGGSGGVGRLGGSSAEHLWELGRGRAAAEMPAFRDRAARLWSEERVREWTNARVRSTVAAGQTPGPAASIGKLHQADLNQRIQTAAVDLLGVNAIAWGSDSARGPLDPASYAASLPRELQGMLRSRANTIEGGTTEVNKNILGERILGIAREPDPWRGVPWREVPRS
jgi:alkylation response protein AidB-like acyl-CoA dehydrogenase